jgi:hypothetical protein
LRELSVLIKSATPELVFMSDAASGPPHALFSPRTPSRRVHYHPLAQAFLLSHAQDGSEGVLA